MKLKLIRTSTVATSLAFLLKGQLAFFDQHYEVIAVSGEDEYLKTVAEREGVKTIPLEMQRSISPLKDVISLWKLYILFKREKPQIVHSITPKAGLLSMIAAKLAGVPIRMHTFTGLIFPTKKGLLQQVLIVMDRLLCFCATNVYPEGQGVKDDLKKYRITSKSLKVIANGNVNGIDTSYFSKEQVAVKDQGFLKKELSITESDFVFVYVGRLVGDKGINELVNVFSQLPNSNSKLLLVGPFESDLDPLQAETVQEIEKNQNIISVGFQSDVRLYFAISDCLVFPSYREGFPNVVLQAGAMGLPSIVTDISGSNEIIVEGQNGIVIPVKNTNALQRVMLKMINEEVFYIELQKNTREMIVSRYEQKVVWEAILDEYIKLEKSV
ncbi:MAG TPA: glycosyltransferase family 4 protein [Flavobacterium sp.]|nr:glycosyltransferase family 4 protein [Flavobacterium sp.]